MQMKPITVITATGVFSASARLAAHVPDVVTPDRLWRSWPFDPLVLFSLALVVWVYARGVRRLWARVGRGRVVSRASVLSFAGGILVLAVALVSPLDALGGTLLSAHMMQHALLAGIAPPLLLMARPGAAFAWGLRPLLSAGPGALAAWRWIIAASHRLSAPALATVVHAVLLWVWHAPSLFNAAVTYDWVHALQHLSFLLPSFLFWRALLDGESPRKAAAPMLAAFLTFMHTGLLGGLITMAPQALYRVYSDRSDAWGLTALGDQQLAGVIMWVPLGLPYLAVGLWLTSRMLALDPPVRGETHS
jgi:putative membrane protein